MSSEQFSATPPPAEERRCPACGVKSTSATATQCWLCHSELSAEAITRHPLARGPELSGDFQMLEAGGNNPPWIAFGLLTLLCCLALLLKGPKLLIVLPVLATPAMVRAVMASTRAKRQGAPPGG